MVPRDGAAELAGSVQPKQVAAARLGVGYRTAQRASNRKSTVSNLAVFLSVAATAMPVASGLVVAGGSRADSKASRSWVERHHVEAWPAIEEGITGAVNYKGMIAEHSMECNQLVSE